MEILILMAVVIVFFLIFAWTMLYFCESEKSPSDSQNVVAPAAAMTNYPNPDVSGTPLPDDGNVANPNQQVINQPDTSTRYNCHLTTHVVNYRSQRPVLPVIPENKEGEDQVAEIQQLEAALIIANCQLQRQQSETITQSVDLRKEFEVERNTWKQLLSEQSEIAQQLRLRVSDLLAEKEELAEELAKNQRKEEEHVKPITQDVGCGSDVLEMEAASTQTVSAAVHDVGCGTEEDGIPHPAQTQSTRQQVDESCCGFTLDDDQMMEQCQNPRRSFTIPASDRTKPTVPAAPKAQVHFASGDVRYKNKPMSGYMVNSDGSKVIYDDAQQSTRKPAAAIPTKNTETARPPVLEQQPKDKPHHTTDGLIVISSPVERLSLPGNKLQLKNLPSGDYGRIVGSGGSNIHRIEKEYRIVASFGTSPDGIISFTITGNTEEARQAAADDIVRGLTVTAEFYNLNVSQRIRNPRVLEIGKKNFVRINRPSPLTSNGRMTLTGKLSSCQSAYAQLLAEI